MMELPTDSPWREFFEEIEREANTAADLSRQMLAYSGMSSFVVKPLDISNGVKRTKSTQTQRGKLNDIQTSKLRRQGKFRLQNTL